MGRMTDPCEPPGRKAMTFQYVAYASQSTAAERLSWLRLYIQERRTLEGPNVNADLKGVSWDKFIETTDKLEFETLPKYEAAAVSNGGVMLTRRARS